LRHAPLQEAFASLAVSVSATTGSTQDGKEHVRKHRELHGEHQLALLGVWRCSNPPGARLSPAAHAVNAPSHPCAVLTTTTATNRPHPKTTHKQPQPPTAVGSRVKYVMDTPEVIWGALDAQEHLEAARRLLRVQEVHAQLHAAFAGLVATKFPVLAHQWQTVLKFRCVFAGGRCCWPSRHCLFAQH
jgi:hypothetical protein